MLSYLVQSQTTFGFNLFKVFFKMLTALVIMLRILLLRKTIQKVPIKVLFDHLYKYCCKFLTIIAFKSSNKRKPDVLINCHAKVSQ
jgi:hypothetical protein